ncbi:NAD(+)/NADH kinase [Luteolibacter arcticus]|uniref:NAD kinase n=1 Tax=Luteolibacter arcticus TaxID=1581411 RepID=A0ABT3GLK0_9BACT|nr:NAD(+)/NADH kinase [Luteolibacter arcticus]MCW1924341.1 NAD(+)/NADH kinase [Luteolibacter arcticus]
MTVGIIANPQKEGARIALDRLMGALSLRRIGTLLEREAAALCGVPGGMDGPDLAAASDVIAVLGGDGTMLNAVAKLGPTDKPVAGINIGTLGFLTSCTDDEVEVFADALLSGEYTTSRRTLLAAKVRSVDGSEKDFRALNEVVLARGQTGRLVSLSAFVDGDLLNSYRADGLIVATPTGSTAYSLSAGGPLISPAAAAFVITPICPHTLSQCSLVVGDHVTVELRPQNADEAPMLFTVDGRDCITIHHGDRIEVRKAAHVLNLLRLSGHSFYEAVRQKLNWRGG